MCVKNQQRIGSRGNRSQSGLGDQDCDDRGREGLRQSSGNPRRSGLYGSGTAVEFFLYFKKLKKFQNIVDNPSFLYYTTKGIEAWLSLVERCVRDAEVASSNLVASTIFG